MAYEYASYAKKGHIATITINRPQVLNAIHPPATVELSAIWDDAIADDNVWVVILTGAGDKAFSAGNDLKYTAEKGMPSGPRPKGGFGGITDRTDVWKPLIAAVAAAGQLRCSAARSAWMNATPGECGSSCAATLLLHSATLWLPCRAALRPSDAADSA